MALLNVRIIPATGSAPNPVAVNASDTIPGDRIGNEGCILDVNNASGGSINVTVVDPGATPSGNPAASSGRVIAVPAATRRQIFVGPGSVNPATGVATINYSATPSVTAEVYCYY